MSLIIYRRHDSWEDLGLSFPWFPAVVLSLNHNLSPAGVCRITATMSKFKRQRVSNTTASSASIPRKVVLWDIDDTLVVINASVLFASPEDRETQKELTTIVKDYLNHFLTKDWKFAESEYLGIAEHISDWDADGKNDDEQLSAVAQDSRAYGSYIREMYETLRTADTSTKEAKLPVGWNETLQIMESRTHHWTAITRGVLAHLHANDVQNMIVTSSELTPALAKLIMWDFDAFFDIEDIYVSAGRNKKDVFLRVLQDIGRRGQDLENIIACGDGLDEERAASSFQIPFKRISNIQDIFSVPGLLDAQLTVNETEIRSYQRREPDIVSSSRAASPGSCDTGGSSGGGSNSSGGSESRHRSSTGDSSNDSRASGCVKLQPGERNEAMKRENKMCYEHLQIYKAQS